ncbi:MAG: hypothetical protein HC770_10575 [Pseudanabaena sp. CRU_2_10]|nr:hypothetical protein [Pseudanabaena sp. CRU_2_10]
MGFQLDLRTREYAQSASQLVQSYSSRGIWSYQNPRLKQELRYVLAAKYWIEALRQLEKLGALHYLHPHLTLSSELSQQLRRVGAWLFHFCRLYLEIDCHNIWQVRLEVAIATYPDAVKIAERLHLNQAGLNRLANFPNHRDRLAKLSADLTPSQVVRLLERLSITEVIMQGAVAPAHIRRLLYRYLNVWNLIKMPLGGHDLKRMGYKPGRHYQTILNALRDRVLDGEIKTVTEAESFVAQQFPLP